MEAPDRTTSTELAVEASGLAKSDPDVRVLAGVDLRVPAGTVFALLGPNGAGKTTTVRILATLVQADGGQARVAGFDVARDRERASPPPDQPHRAVRRAARGADGHREPAHDGPGGPGCPGPRARQRAAELLGQFEVTKAACCWVATYSGGMRRRLDIAASLVGRPFGELPRRAVDRPGPAEPAGHVAGHRGPGRIGRDHLPHHPVPGGGRPAGRPDRGPGRGPDHRRGHRRGTQGQDRRPATGPDRRQPGRLHRASPPFQGRAPPTRTRGV